MPRTSRQRRPTVGLLSPHPLVLEELQHLLGGTRFHLRARRLFLGLPPQTRRLAIPAADFYVVDAQGLRTATEALVAGLAERFPAARVLVVGEHLDEAFVFPLLRLGAKGLLSYAELRQRLRRALEVVAAGGFWVPRTLLSRFVDSMLLGLRGRRSMAAAAGLSAREQQVLDALLENLSNKEIAGKLHLSERTVKFHVSNLLSKFGVQRRADLILACLQAGAAAR
ncbi:MAG: response regulator transcription factor [Acidobacteria bacterium]|nr:response regulator transcription factor [Acidobacteriota bacterium]